MMTFRRKRLLLGAAALAASASLALVGCSSTGSANSMSGAAATAITIANNSSNGSTGTFTDNFNPWLKTGSALEPTLGPVYESLFYYNTLNSNAPEPMLGTAFKWNDAGTQLTITVRKGVEWNNGTAMTPADVAYTFSTINSTPGLNTYGMNWTTTVQGDDVVLTFPKVSFTAGQALLGNTAIVPKAVWQNKDPMKDANADPVGTGPYMLDKFNPQVVSLKVNPHYWGTGKDKPTISTVRYIPMTSADAAGKALAAGTIDWDSNFIPTLKDLIKQHPNITYQAESTSSMGVETCSNVAYGCKGPQTDAAVRQAINYAVDRNQMINQSENGFASETSLVDLVPGVYGSWISDKEGSKVPMTADTAKAKAALEADGWTMGPKGYYQKGGKELDLTINVPAGWVNWDTDCTLMQAQLKAAGINLTVAQMAQNAWVTNEYQGTFQLSLEGVYPGGNGPLGVYNNYFVTWATSKVGSKAAAYTYNNITRFSDPASDAAIKDVLNTNPSDTAELQKDYTTVEDALLKDMPIIPLYAPQAVTIFNTSRVTGWPNSTSPYAYAPVQQNWDPGIILRSLRPATSK